MTWYARNTENSWRIFFLMTWIVRSCMCAIIKAMSCLKMGRQGWRGIYDPARSSRTHSNGWDMYMNEPCLTYEWVLSQRLIHIHVSFIGVRERASFIYQIWRSLVAQTYESCRKGSFIYMSHSYTCRIHIHVSFICISHPYTNLECRREPQSYTKYERALSHIHISLVAKAHSYTCLIHIHVSFIYMSGVQERASFIFQI